MNLTKKQRTIMKMVCAGNVDSSGNLECWLDLDQLIEKCGKDNTKQAMQFSVRYLENKGMLTKAYEVRRAARRMVLAPTGLAFEVMNGSPED
jgi:hypothetical protein